MRLKKMLRLLREAIEKKASLYTEKELDYMKHQLDVIQSEILRLEHRDYRGFGKK